MNWYLPAAIVLIACVIGFAPGVDADVDKGAERMELDGGSQGIVSFPHRRHQDALGDCLVCHNTFAQVKGSINKAKAEGALARKQVMNKLCIQCHRAQKQTGKTAGPTTCSKCHIKEKE